MSSPRLNVAWLVQPDLTALMLTPELRAQVEAMTDVTWWQGDSPPTADEAASALGVADVAVFSWGAPRLTEQVLEDAPNLRRVHYAAGSVKGLVDDALWQNEIQLTSAAAAIAENVADFTLGLIILGLANYFDLAEASQRGEWNRDTGTLGQPRALSGCTIGILGAGQVGQRVLQRLQPFPVDLLLYDPFVEAATAAAYGAQKVELDELLRRADVVTLHVPNLPETRHLFTRERLALMRDDAILINTARGASIDETALVEELRKGRFFALLDVTDPEPPAPDHPFRTLPNVRLTPHIAGGLNNGRQTIGRLIVRELLQDITDQPPLYPVTQEMLATIA